jgi:hypothetical protein
MSKFCELPKSRSDELCAASLVTYRETAYRPATWIQIRKDNSFVTQSIVVTVSLDFPQIMAFRGSLVRLAGQGRVDINPGLSKVSNGMIRLGEGIYLYSGH